MLNVIESRIAAIVGDGLAARTHLSVVQAPRAIDGLQPGRGIMRVSLSEMTPDAGFERTQVHFTNGSAPTSRRTLPVRFGSRLEFRMRPQTASAANQAAARTRLLEDLSLASHLLGAMEVRSGTAFEIAAPDPGFKVLSFEVRRGTAGAQLENGVLSAEILCEGKGFIWPPSVSRDEGIIEAVDPVLALPVDIRVDHALVPLGGTTMVSVRSFGGSRLTDTDGTRAPAALAVSVVSDLPPERRGLIASGSNGMETGVRIVRAGSPVTRIGYLAPTGDVGPTRVEYVAIHLARPDGRSGPFLGSAAVRLAVEED
jgi:hypothetical protein